MQTLQTHDLDRVVGGAGAAGGGQILNGVTGALNGVSGLLGGIASLKNANTERKVAEAQLAGGGGGGAPPGGPAGQAVAAMSSPMGDPGVKISTNVSITR